MKLTAAAIVILIAACRPARLPAAASEKIYALKYAESNYPARLMNTPQKSGLVRINWLAYLILADDGSYTLVDCGFSDFDLAKRFKLRNFRPVTSLLGDLGIESGAIQRIVLTHTHFDHALDVDLFPTAKVYVHQLEARKPREPRLVSKMRRLAAENRLVTITGPTILLSHWELRPGGGHTPGSLTLWSLSPARPQVFTGDECYFAASCREKIALPRAAAFDEQKNQIFMNSLPREIRIYAGHEATLTGGHWIHSQVFLFDQSVI